MIIPLAAATLSTQASIVVLAPIVVEVANAFGVSVSAVGQARAVLAGTAVVGSLSIGSLIDRIGVRPLLLVGSLLSLSGAVITSLAPTITLFYLAQIPAGLGVACMLSGGFAGVGVYFEDRDVPWAMGYVVGLQSLAWIVGNPVIGLLTDAGSWRLAYLVPAVVSLIALAATLLVLPRLPMRPRGDVSSRGGLRLVFRDRSARRWSLSELMAYSVWTAELTFAGAFYVESYGVTQTALGFLLSLPSAVFLVSSPRVAGLANRIGQKQVVILGGVGMGVVLLVLFAFTPSIWFTLPVFCLVAVFAALRLTGSSTLGLGQLPQRPGAMMSARTASAQLGYMIGSLVGGFVLAAGGFPALGVFLFVGLVLASLLVLGVTVPDSLPGGGRVDTGEAPQLMVPD